MKMRFYSTLAISVCLMFAAACGAGREEKIRQEMEKSLLAVNIPVDIKNATDAPDLKQDASHVVSITGGQYFLGRNQYPVDTLEDAIKKFVGAGKTIDLQADFHGDYGDVVRVLDGIRRSGSRNIALLVRPDTHGEPKRFSVTLEPEPTVDDKPDTSIPTITLAKTGKVSIEKKEIGTLEELDKLTATLKTTPVSTVRIRAYKGARYADVVRIADAAKSGGAGQIILVIDDLVD